MAQDGSKRLLKRNFFALENRLNFCLVLDAILDDFGLPNPPPKVEMRVRIGVLKLVFFTMIFSCCFGSAPRRPKRRPRGPKTPPRAPQEAPRGPQERPKRLQEALKRPQEPVKRALQLQRCLAKMPCHRMQGGHAKKWRAGGGVPPKGQAIRRPQRSGGYSGVSDHPQAGPNQNCRSLICLTYGKFLSSWSQLVFRSLS